MCTVSYLPKNKGFILTSNRDELVSRKSAQPAKFTFKDQELIFPKDPLVMGSWIAMSKIRVLCLLNGALHAHTRKDKYRMSRGLVLLDALTHEKIEDFIDHYNLVDIEPFTLVWVDIDPLRMYELIWDGNKLSTAELKAGEPHFWSSATLYNLNWRVIRKKWFEDWWAENEHDFTPQQILNFHKTGGEKNDDYGLIMSRNTGMLKTISVTQINAVDTLAMEHVDLIDNKVSRLTF